MHSILVIDDEELMRNFLIKALQRYGFQVTAAQDGEEGLSLCHHNPIELVITDIYMPKCDGYETIRQLRKLLPKVKIIGMSGGCPKLSELPTLEIARVLGADRVIGKPFHIIDLLKLIKESFDDAATQVTCQ